MEPTSKPIDASKLRIYNALARRQLRDVALASSRARAALPFSAQQAGGSVAQQVVGAYDPLQALEGGMGETTDQKAIDIGYALLREKERLEAEKRRRALIGAIASGGGALLGGVLGGPPGVTAGAGAGRALAAAA